MGWKLYSSILVTLFVVDLVPALADEQLRTRDVLPPGTSPHASRPVVNAEPQAEEFFAPHRHQAALPGTSPQPSIPSTSGNVQQPVANAPIRNNAAMPTEELDRPAAQEPLQNVNPTEQPVVNAPVRNNDGAPLGNFGRGHEGPSRHFHSHQPTVNNPVSNNNNNVPMPTGNAGGVREEPVQNSNPIVTDNGAVRDNGMGRNLAQPTATVATNSNQRETGPAAFGGAAWPDFFRRPNVPTTNTAASDVPMLIPSSGAGQPVPLQNPQATGGQSVPMQNPQFGAGQGGQSSPTVDNLLEKLNNLNNLLGNNQGGGGGGGLGR